MVSIRDTPEATDGNVYLPVGKAKISDEPAQDFLAVPDGALRRVAV
jgi:hypothetical protein